MKRTAPRGARLFLVLAAILCALAYRGILAMLEPPTGAPVSEAGTVEHAVCWDDRLGRYLPAVYGTDC